MKPPNCNLQLSLLLSMQCLLALAQQDIDSNKMLTDFIWSKIISKANKNSPASSSKASPKSPPPHISLVTVPYKPSPSAPSPFSKSPLTRRSSYSSNLTPAASSSSFSYEASDKGSIASKYFMDSKATPFSESTSSKPVPQIKSSYSGSETGKNYFVSVIQNEPSRAHSESMKHESSKSLYDLVPMPTYGVNSKYGGGEDQNNLYQKKRTLEIMPMIREGGKQYGPPMEPQIIEVTPDDQPIQVVFRSTSARVQVSQIHTPSKPEEVETIRTEEEPQKVQHMLMRPVIQEVFEVIQPYRKVTQEVRPVLEEIHTVVAKQEKAGNGGPQGPGNQGGNYGNRGNNMRGGGGGPSFGQQQQQYGRGNFNAGPNDLRGNGGGYGKQARNYR